MQASIYSFHGGVHPPENKAQSLKLPLGKPALPKELILPLDQHIGQASRPLVSVGEQVRKGQAIAMNNGLLSSFLHAPTSGTISAIEERTVAHPSGLTDLCIILVPDGKEEWAELTPLENWRDAGKAETIAFLAEKGIVGLGGAGFPTQVKLQAAHKHTLSHFIINAAECEPYITADDMLMRERTLELILGVEMMQHVVEAKHVVIGIEDNKPVAIAALKQLLEDRHSSIKVAIVPTKYPSGGERQLIQLLTEKEVPNGHHPADIGILCQNVGTCVAVYDAIQHGIPLISRFTTLTGDALKAPQNAEVLLGTPIDHLLSYAELQESKLDRLIMGGPMMGFTLNNAQVPIVKTTNCILAASHKELPPPAPEQACIRCGMCEQACPASLLPQQLLWFAKSQENDKAEYYNLFDCIECGACSYVCPSSIPLVQYYRHSKAEIREAKEATVKSDIAKQRFEARKARQEAEAAEKEAKRLARQKAASEKPKKAAPTKAPVTEATEQKASTSNLSEAAKKAKVDVALTSSKLKKAEKQLAENPDDQALKDKVASLSAELKTAQETLDKLGAATTPSAPAAKPALSEAAKKAKIDVALAGSKLKKAQKQLAESPDDQALIDKVSGFEKDLEEAQARLAEHEQSAPSPTPASSAPNNEQSADADATRKLKIDAAMAKAAVKKAEKALAKAQELQSDDIDSLSQQVEQAKARTQALEQALQNGSHQTTVPTPSASDDQADAEYKERLKKQKVAAALAKAQVNKLKKQLAADPTATTLQQDLAAAEQKQQAEEAKLEQLTNTQENR